VEPALRIYQGCGRAYLGEIEGANIIKIHRRSGKLSYLIYPDFETDPHPALLRCIRLNLRSRQITCYDYADSANPPILHRKESFLSPEDPLYERFARLTKQEEQHGLLKASGQKGDSPLAEEGQSPFSKKGDSPLAEEGQSPFSNKGDSPLAEEGRSPFSSIGTRDGWARRLNERGFALRGHRLVRQNEQRRNSSNRNLAGTEIERQNLAAQEIESQ
jgi:hypothetical protein